MSANNINFIVHTEKGLILRTGICSEASYSRQATGDEWIVEGVAQPGDIVTGGLPASRLVNTITQSKLTITPNGSDSVVFGGIQNDSDHHTTCTILSPSDVVPIPKFEILDGNLTFKSFATGVFSIEIDSFPHMIFQTTVTAL